jgi:hypothetical protein
MEFLITMRPVTGFFDVTLERPGKAVESVYIGTFLDFSAAQNTAIEYARGFDHEV